MQEKPLKHVRIMNVHTFNNYQPIADITHFNFVAIADYVNGDMFEIVTGKNVLKIDATSQINNGITFTVNADTSISINGTASETEGAKLFLNLNISSYLSVGNTYTLSGSSLPYEDCSIKLYIKYKDGTKVYYVIGSSKISVFEITQDIEYAEIYIKINEGRTINNVTIYPQLTIGTTVEPYTPYKADTYTYKSLEPLSFKKGDKVEFYAYESKKELLFYDAFYVDEKSEYKTLLPPIFQDVIEINTLDNAITIQLSKLNALIKESVDNKSITYATEQGVARWEKIIGVSSPINSTLQARKDALKAKLIAKPPINMCTLKTIIEAYMGLQVDITLKDYQITVKYRGTSRIADLKPLYATIYETIPASMLLDIAYAFATYAEETARFTTYADQAGYTYEQIKKGEF